MKRNQMGKNNPSYKHGFRYHPLYGAFHSAFQRCTNPNNPSYKTYKGRWGKNTPVELTEHYKEEYEELRRKHPNKKIHIHRKNNGKYEIGEIELRLESDHNAIHGKDREIPIECYIHGKWRHFISAAEAERETSAHHQHISACCKGKRKTAGGYKWRYA